MVVQGASAVLVSEPFAQLPVGKHFPRERPRSEMAESFPVDRIGTVVDASQTAQETAAFCRGPIFQARLSRWCAGGSAGSIALCVKALRAPGPVVDSRAPVHRLSHQSGAGRVHEAVQNPLTKPIRWRWCELGNAAGPAMARTVFPGGYEEGRLEVIVPIAPGCGEMESRREELISGCAARGHGSASRSSWFWSPRRKGRR
jgi:hypothetical protein